MQLTNLLLLSDKIHGLFGGLLDLGCCESLRSGKPSRTRDTFPREPAYLASLRSGSFSQNSSDHARDGQAYKES